MQEMALILEHEVLCEDVHKMKLKTGLARLAKPGQFIEITVPGFYLFLSVKLAKIH